MAPPVIWQHKIEAWQMPAVAPNDFPNARFKLAERLDAIALGGWELAHYNAIEIGNTAHISTIWKRPVP